MNEIVRLSFENQSFRMVEIEGETWWVLKDICQYLEIENHKDITKRMDEDEVGRFEYPHPQNPDKIIKMLCVNECGLYSVILRSDKPKAKLFRRWVTHEVLPEIHRTGKYSAVKSESILNDPRLTAPAKTIFMYLCSCSGGRSELNTNRKKVLHDLNMGADMYKNHLDKLKKYGYVSTERIRGTDGRIGGVKFIINFPVCNGKVEFINEDEYARLYENE